MNRDNEPALPRIVVCGSAPRRNRPGWSDPELIERVLRSYGPAIIVHGAAPGADELAGVVARQLRWPVEEYPADWKRHGRAAGPKRNIEMLDTRPSLVIAFTLVPGGTPGTRHILTTGRDEQRNEKCR